MFYQSMKHRKSMFLFVFFLLFAALPLYHKAVTGRFANVQGAVARSMVSAKHWLRSIETYKPVSMVVNTG